MKKVYFIITNTQQSRFELDEKIQVLTIQMININFFHFLQVNL